MDELVIERLTRLDVGPGEALLVQMAGPITHATIDVVHQVFAEALPGVKVVVADESVTVSAIKDTAS